VPAQSDVTTTATAANASVGAATAVGIGLRHPHYAALFETTPRLGFVEVHSENFFADGGASINLLHQVREQYAISLHGVGLALGSAAGLDPWHLERLARLVKRIEPARISDHACFARAASSSLVSPDHATSAVQVSHANDLLPIAFTEASLDIMASNVMRVQERIGRELLVENLSAYVSFTDDSMTEPEFFVQLCRRTGCKMLLDVNNIMVNELNAAGSDFGLAHARADALAACVRYVDALPRDIIGELHLAGYCDTASIVIDDHGSRVRPDVWKLYEHTLRRLGTVPTLIEWDTDLPEFGVLLGEAQLARRIVDRVASDSFATSSSVPQT
jgi:uncharacterized protein (UPF0276 family)